MSELERKIAKVAQDDLEVNQKAIAELKSLNVDNKEQANELIKWLEIKDEWIMKFLKK